jgi:hypothetical protein
LTVETDSALHASSDLLPGREESGTSPGLKLFAADEPAGSLAPGDQARPTPGGLTDIMYDHDAATAADQAAALLVSADNLYLRGDQLAEFDDDHESPRLRPLDKTLLRKQLDRRMRWFSHATGKRIRPPAEVIGLVLTDARRLGLRTVRGVITTPTVRPDGSLLAVAGYDPSTGLILAPEIELAPIPDAPTWDDAQAAWDRLFNEALVDFPFVDDVARAVTLAALLTLTGRSTYAGPTPMFGVTANRRGAGKDLLCRVMTTIALGRAAASSSPPQSDSEMRRRITALARADARVVVLGNVERPLGGAALEEAMTASSWSDRILNQSEMTSDLPLNITWFATGNRLRTMGDFARRMLPIRLESREEFPEMRNDFRHPDLLAHVAAHRASLLRDCLMMLRAFHVAGRPEQPTRLGSFEAWSGAIAGAVHWVTGVDPISSRAAVAATDAGEVFRSLLVAGWAALPGGTEGLTVRDAIAALQTRDDFAGFREALEAEFATSDPGVLKRKLGNHLRTLDGCMVGGRVLVKVGQDGVQNVARWAVRTQVP